MGAIGSNIKAARKHAGLNQSQLAQKAGITKAAISRYESGLREPRSEHLKAIAEALGVTTDELLGIAPLPQQEIPLYECSQEKAVLTSADQEFEAFDSFLESMGYRTFLDLGTFNNTNPNHNWTMCDLRSGKKYFISTEKLNQLMYNINSYTKFQISSIISELTEIPDEEKAPGTINAQD